VTQHYASLGPVLELQTCGGFGINSSNISFRTSDARFVAKRLSDGSSKSLSQQASLTQQLSARGEIPIPPLVTNAEGALLTPSADAVWILQEFAEGQFFTGVRGQTLAFFDVLVALARSLSEPWANQIQLPEFPCDYLAVADSLASPDFRDVAWPEVVGEPLRSLLECHWVDVISPAARCIIEAKIARVALPPRPCHIDLHPNNVLMDTDGVAAIVDWESFRLSSPSVMVGFSLIKMGRQAVAKGLSVPEVRFAQEAVCAELEEPFEEAIAAGLAEILRRLHTVLTLNKESQDHSWNMVLPLLLQNLAEGLRFLDSSETSPGI